MKVEGWGGSIELFDDRVVIRPKGVLGFLSRGFANEKTILLKNVSAVQYRDPGIANGYVRLIVQGESGGGVNDSDNTVYFLKNQTAEFQSLRKAIEEKIAAPAATSPTAFSIADDLGKLSELLAKGLLTQSEFDAAKIKLLR